MQGEFVIFSANWERGWHFFMFVGGPSFLAFRPQER
jgi:hypothetical protein